MRETLSLIKLPINEIRNNNLKKDEITSNTDKETNFSYKENTDNSNNNYKSEIKYIKNENKNTQIKKNSQSNKLLTEKPIYKIPIDEIIKNINIYNNSIKTNNNENKNFIILNIKEKETKKDKNIQYKNKPMFMIPIVKIEEEMNMKNKLYELNNKKNDDIINNNTKNQIKNEDKNKNINYLKNVSNKNLNDNNKINNDLFFNNTQQNINNNKMPYLNGFSDINFSNSNYNYNYSNYVNNYYNDTLLKIIEQKAQFKILKDMGMRALMNQQNLNHYLLNSNCIYSNIYNNNV